jgi:hypothetical protein
MEVRDDVKLNIELHGEQTHQVSLSNIVVEETWLEKVGVTVLYD